MDDSQIVALYHARDERAIAETDRSYGKFCFSIAMNVLSYRQDAEECVNDTWLAAWDRMPPALPNSLKAFLGRITRNLSISRFRANTAAKRHFGMESLLSELEECIPAPASVEQVVETQELSRLISNWLDTLDWNSRLLFIRRYWYGDPVNTLSQTMHRSPNTISQQLRRLRRRLRSYLEENGVTV